VSRIVWTRPAVDDVREIRDYISRDSPRYGLLVAERLYSAVGRLQHHPLSGREVPELGRDDVREVIYPPYRIVYRVRDDLVEVLTVVHTARRFPADDIARTK